MIRGLTLYLSEPGASATTCVTCTVRALSTLAPSCVARPAKCVCPHQKLSEAEVRSQNTSLEHTDLVIYAREGDDDLLPRFDYCAQSGSRDVLICHPCQACSTAALSTFPTERLTFLALHLALLNDGIHPRQRGRTPLIPSSSDIGTGRRRS